MIKDIILFLLSPVWEGYKKRIRPMITGGTFNSVSGDGLSFTIKNIGHSEIPEFNIALFHPLCGSLFLFTKVTNGPLLPDQEVCYEFVILVNGDLKEPSRKWFVSPTGEQMTDKEKDDYSFRLVMEKSDKVLYENRKIGAAFVRVCTKVADARSNKNVTYEEMMALQYLPLSIWVRFRQFFRPKRRAK